MVELHVHDADAGHTEVWSVEPADLPKVIQGLKNLPIETLLGEPVTTIRDKVAWRYAHMKLVERVAARFKLATYFGVGSIVLYGKYKNHRGKIVGFGQDKWGNPTVEIEPIPKGRKQNKVLGLFRIWRADVKEKALAEQAMLEHNKAL